MSMSFADKMRQRFAARAAERSQTQPAPAGAVAGKLPVSGPPPAAKPVSAKPARAPKARSWRAVLKDEARVLNLAGVGGAFRHVYDEYSERLKGRRNRRKKDNREAIRAANIWFWRAIRENAASLLGKELDPRLKVGWSAKNGCPRFTVPMRQKKAGS